MDFTPGSRIVPAAVVAGSVEGTPSDGVLVSDCADPQPRTGVSEEAGRRWETPENVSSRAARDRELRIDATPTEVRAINPSDPWAVAAAIRRGSRRPGAAGEDEVPADRPLRSADV
ncbi:MAG: hypothetical protein WCF36_11275 [Candidatus Nanopelagicales bacterium]